MPYNKPQPGEEIVISGISGVYPQCENISVLAQKLFAKEDLITDLTENFSMGKLKSTSKFDAGFFNITNEHAEYMDPQCRILLEKTYEAISDAGYSYLDFKNTNTAVYVANCSSDAYVENESRFRTDIKSAIVLERCPSFLANRISYWLGTYGPSCTVNAACSSSSYALEFAYNAIRRGECDAAIIGGSSLCLSPIKARIFKNLIITSPRCRSFDNKAIGFCPSEAISTILIQKARHARRIYAEVIHIKTINDGYKKQSIFFPCHITQTKLINELHEECIVPKKEVSWVEAHGTGTKVGDYQEMKALQTFCDGRSDSLLVGCVKSNLGHTEATSGLCSIAKVIIAMESGVIPPNLHFTSPQSGIETLHTNKIRIITEKTPWEGGYVAINNFGVGGSNAHLLLKSNTNQHNSNQNDNIPRLVNISGRTEESVESIMSYLHSIPINIELTGLLHKIFSIGISSHEFRGYTILDTENGTKTKQLQQVKNQKRSLWFIYPGMGSQWVSMGKEFMVLPEFHKSIMECHNILKPYGLNLLQIVSDTDPKTFQNILNCFVGITAFMIALTDLLKSIKLEHDFLIGHSFGEIMCGYAENCLNKKQALLMAYYRGLISTETSTLKALMAVIGLNGELAKKRCPSGVEVVCFNGDNCCTIAGPQDSVEKLIKEFKSENILANEMFSDNIAYHSSYIRSAGSVYENYLQKLISTPKKRSSKWISSSVPEESWGANTAEYCSAEYFRNNFINPVLMDRCLKYIPDNAITIEIAPHSIFKTVLNETLNESIVNISLINKNHSRPLHHFLRVLGTLYNYNVDMDISKLYPPLIYPVSRGTPMISPLIKWNHKDDWYVPFENFDLTSTKNEHSVTISYENEDFHFLRGCIIDGKNLFPESGLLKIVWEAFAQKKKENFREMSVIFRNVKFHKAVEIPENEKLYFDVTILHENGNFEITSKDGLIVNGCIHTLPNQNQKIDSSTEINDLKLLTTDDIYQDLKIKGYHYGNQFRTIISSNMPGTMGTVKRTENWTLFLDSLIQFLYSSTSMSNFHLVHYIGTLEINVVKNSKILNKNMQEVPVKISPAQIESGGIKFKNVNLKAMKRQPVKTPTLQTVDFTSYLPGEVFSIQKVVRAIITIILENCLISRMNIIEFVNSMHHSPILSTYIHDHFQLLPFYKVDIMLKLKNEDIKTFNIPTSFRTTTNTITRNNTHLLILTELEDRTEVNEEIERMKIIIEEQNKILEYISSLAENGFLLIRQRMEKDDLKIPGLHKFATYNLGDEKLALWHKTTKYEIHRVVRLNPENFDWIQPLQELLNENNMKIILYSDSYTSGIIGFFNCMRKENGGHDLRCFLILDQTVLPFDLNNKFYGNQLKHDLAMNVYQNGHWGCYVPNIFEPTECLVPNIYLDEDLETETLYWAEDDSNFQIETLIRVNYVSIPNHIEYFYDFENYSQNHTGTSLYEFSGKDYLENYVMGISFSGKISTSINKTECICWIIPEGIALHDAATIPFAYITALHIFQDKPQRRKDDVILIQNACSCYGQAILTIALDIGCQVYTIENHSEESRHIRTHFPQVLNSFVGVSDDLNELQTGSCKDRITMLLLSENQPYTPELLYMVKKGGEVIFIGPEENAEFLCGDIMLRNLLFRTVNPAKLFDTAKDLIKLRSSFQKILQNGSIKPFYQKAIETNLSIVLKRSNNVQYRTVLQLPMADIIQNKGAVYKAKPRFTCSKNESIIICGGLGGMGFELANWLADRGAKKLILVSRTGFCNGYKQKKISQLEEKGVKIIIVTDNIATYKGVTNLLEMAENLGPVSAIFNTTLILHDKTFEKQTTDSFQETASPKATATIILDKLSRKICPSLKKFVVFSSVACGYGNAGQTNYGYANSVMERICEKRRQEGLPGLAIEWAGIADVGYLENVKNHKIPAGTQLQPIRSCLKVLDEFLCQQNGIVTSFITADHESPTVTAATSIFPTIQKIIGKSGMEISEVTTLEDIGLDSIAVAETRNILKKKYNIFLNAKEILKLQVHTLWDIEKKGTKSDNRENESNQKLLILENFYKNIFKIMAKEKSNLAIRLINRLPSILQGGTTIEVPVTKEKTVFFFPSVEGFSAVMKPLAKNIDFQVLCAQYDIRWTSVRQITRTLLPEIETRLISAEPFHILGYSYGGLIAMEIVHELEKQGRTGYLYLIDSALPVVKEISRVLFKDQGYLTNAMAFVRALNPAINMSELSESLRKQKNWESVRAYIKEVLPENLQHTKDDLDAILHMVHERVNEAESYHGIPRKSLVSKVFLFKPKEQLFHSVLQSDLEEFCKESDIQELVVDGNHFTILKSEALAYHIMNLHKN